MFTPMLPTAIGPTAAYVGAAAASAFVNAQAAPPQAAGTQPSAKTPASLSMCTAQGPVPLDPQPTSLPFPEDTVTAGDPTRRMSAGQSTYFQPAYANDQRKLGDGFDSSRDIVGVEAREGAAAEPYKLRVSLANLRAGAENGNLDVYWLVGTGQPGGATSLPDRVGGGTAKPWNLAVAAYDTKHFTVQAPGNVLRSGGVTAARFDPVTRVVEVDLDKSVLRSTGWRDGAPVTLQAFTSKDFSGQITDSLDAPKSKPWSNGDRLEAVADTGQPPRPIDARSADWAGESIYFVFTDRFQDGDPNNNHGVDRGDLRRYQGGDLRGVIDRLDYIKDLGMTTIWLSPPWANQTRYENYEGFHGYWPVDHYRVDPRQGDLQTMKELVEKAHEKGLKVVMDIALNHTAWEHPWRNDPAKRSWFHHNGNITDWEDPHQLENFDVLWLPDLAQENPEVERTLIDVGKFWIDQTGIDGFRLDAVKHVGRPFWQKFTAAMHEHAGPDFLILGEDLHGSADHVARYQHEGMQGMLDFPLYFSIRDTIGRGGSMRYLADRLAEENGKFDSTRMLGLFLDNHDVNRFLFDAGANGREKLKLALAFAFTINRIPTMYQGTELGMDGAHEVDSPTKMPDNRKFMEWGKDPELTAYFATLSRLRQSTPALRQGGYLEMWKDDQVFAYARVARDSSAMVVLNGSGDAQRREIPVRAMGRNENGTRLKDALSGREFTVVDGKIAVDLPPRTPLILLPSRS